MNMEKVARRVVIFLMAFLITAVVVALSRTAWNWVITPPVWYSGSDDFEGGAAAKTARAEFCSRFLTPDDPKMWRFIRCPDALR